MDELNRLKQKYDDLIRAHHDFAQRVLGVRDALQPIVDGEIERGHCSPGTRECYGGRPGKRKLLLKDAKHLVRHGIAALNSAMAKMDEQHPEQLGH